MQRPSLQGTEKERALAAAFGEINAAFERAHPRRPSWVPQGPWNGLADSMDAAKWDEEQSK